MRAQASAKWLRRVEEEILPAVTALPFDLDCAREYGRVRAELMRAHPHRARRRHDRRHSTSGSGRPSIRPFRNSEP